MKTKTGTKFIFETKTSLFFTEHLYWQYDTIQQESLTWTSTRDQKEQKL